jgi:hypothetical protein
MYVTQSSAVDARRGEVWRQDVVGTPTRRQGQQPCHHLVPAPTAVANAVVEDDVRGAGSALRGRLRHGCFFVDLASAIGV